MATKDTYTTSVILNAVPSTVINANGETDGDVIDTQGFYSLTFNAKATAYTDGEYGLIVLESDETDPSSFTPTDSNFTIQANGSGQILSANSPIAIGYVGKKRYAKLRIVALGVTAGATITGDAILGVPQSAPTS